MRSGSFLIFLACSLVLIVGCEVERSQMPTNDKAINTELLNAYNNIQIENAIITQHTLYPYHFGDNSDKLKELGKRDFAVLTKHFSENPGPLNVSRTNVPDSLYKSRLAAVADMLQKAGIDKNRITIEDGLPGGSGMPAESVVKILAKPSKAVQTTGAETTMPSTGLGYESK